ncbi:hypothetical protein [Megasphaera sp.]|uniref:hypothetical protein n=1 Tax=Megasphaera sp. TaxID=2023260 RepID=UPI003078F276
MTTRSDGGQPPFQPSMTCRQTMAASCRCLVMQSDGLEGKAQGRREQAGSEEQARQTVGQEKEAIGLRRYGCARSAPPRR